MSTNGTKYWIGLQVHGPHQPLPPKLVREISVQEFERLEELGGAANGIGSADVLLYQLERNYAEITRFCCAKITLPLAALRKGPQALTGMLTELHLEFDRLLVNFLDSFARYRALEQSMLKSRFKGLGKAIKSREQSIEGEVPGYSLAYALRCVAHHATMPAKGSTMEFSTVGNMFQGEQAMEIDLRQLLGKGNRWDDPNIPKKLHGIDPDNFNVVAMATGALEGARRLRTEIRELEMAQLSKRITPLLEILRELEGEEGEEGDPSLIKITKGKPVSSPLVGVAARPCIVRLFQMRREAK